MVEVRELVDRLREIGQRAQAGKYGEGRADVDFLLTELWARLDAQHAEQPDQRVAELERSARGMLVALVATPTIPNERYDRAVKKLEDALRQFG